jgi:hypothetical protein
VENIRNCDVGTADRPGRRRRSAEVNSIERPRTPFDIADPVPHRICHGSRYRPLRIALNTGLFETGLNSSNSSRYRRHSYPA